MCAAGIVSVVKLGGLLLDTMKATFSSLTFATVFNSVIALPTEYDHSVYPVDFETP